MIVCWGDFDAFYGWETQWHYSRLGDYHPSERRGCTEQPGRGYFAAGSLKSRVAISELFE